jgi:hypothetical protein
MKYKSKQIIEIEAEQFLPPLRIPKGVMNVYQHTNGVYFCEIWTRQGRKLTVKEGEWIVQEDDLPGTYYSIDNEVFLRKYEISEDSKKRELSDLTDEECIEGANILGMIGYENKDIVYAFKDALSSLPYWRNLFNYSNQ